MRYCPNNDCPLSEGRVAVKRYQALMNAGDFSPALLDEKAIRIFMYAMTMSQCHMGRLILLRAFLFACQDERIKDAGFSTVIFHPRLSDERYGQLLKSLQANQWFSYVRGESEESIVRAYPDNQASQF